MKKLLVLSVAIFLAVSLGCAEPSGEKGIQKAISKVYPALVFVKPIHQDLSAGEKRSFQVFGSGSIISSDGYIVTNNHVAEKAKEITCILYNREEVKAEVIGLDPEADIAVLKLDPADLARVMKEKNMAVLPVAQWGDSNTVREGMSVLALGAPFGFTRSVTKGIVSSTERYFDDFPHHLWIQTDASINPGNSGGPLVNLKGEIVGINTLGMFGSGLGFSIPSNVAIEIVKRIIRDKKVIRSNFGITYQAIHDFTRSSHLKAAKGVIVANVERGSAAEEAGILAGDIITACNGKEINALYQTDLPALTQFMAYLPVGVEVELTVQRKDEILKFRVTPREKGRFEGDEFECKSWNCVMKEITKESSPYLYFLRPGGVFVFGVKYRGNAQVSGLYRGDIVVAINGKPVNNIDDLKALYEELDKRPKGQRKVPMVMNRSGLEVLIVLDYETDVKKIEEEEQD